MEEEVVPWGVFIDGGNILLGISNHLRVGDRVTVQKGHIVWSNSELLSSLIIGKDITVTAIGPPLLFKGNSYSSMEIEIKN